MAKHALLSASSSHRWLECPPSAKLCAAHPDRASPYAQQGTDAHELAAYKVQKALGMKARDPTEDLEYFDQEMADCTDAYCAFVMEQLAEARKHCADPIVLVEQRLDFSRWVPEGFGTGDACIVADDVLHVIDLKYGVGIMVDATQNPQTMCYALGLLEAFDGIYDVSTVRMTIFQPRRENISTFEMSKADLLGWAENVLAPTAKLAFNGEGEFKAGDHCQFCRAAVKCRARAEEKLRLAQKEFSLPPLLSDDEVEEILTKLPDITKWANDLMAYATDAALYHGKTWNGFKVVEGRSVRKYSDEDAVAKAANKAGYRDIYIQKLIGLTEMQKLMGKAEFEKVIGPLLIKPPGKPTLVPSSDKRPAINISNATTDFQEFMED